MLLGFASASYTAMPSSVRRTDSLNELHPAAQTLQRHWLTAVVRLSQGKRGGDAADLSLKEFLKYTNLIDLLLIWEIFPSTRNHIIGI